MLGNELLNGQSKFTGLRAVHCLNIHLNKGSIRTCRNNSRIREGSDIIGGQDIFCTKRFCKRVKLYTTGLAIEYMFGDKDLSSRLTIHVGINGKALRGDIRNSDIGRHFNTVVLLNGNLVKEEHVILLYEITCKGNVLTLSFIVIEINSVMVMLLRTLNIHGIYGHKSGEVSRICHNTDNHSGFVLLTIVGMYYTPESNL